MEPNNLISFVLLGSLKLLQLSISVFELCEPRHGGGGGIYVCVCIYICISIYIYSRKSSENVLTWKVLKLYFDYDFLS